MNQRFAESVVEDATLGWLASLGYAILHGPDIAAGEPAAERSDQNYRDVVLEGRLRQALVCLNGCEGSQRVRRVGSCNETRGKPELSSNW